MSFKNTQHCFDLFKKYLTDGTNYYHPTHIVHDNNNGIKMFCDKLILEDGNAQILKKEEFHYTSDMVETDYFTYDYIVELIKTRYYLIKNIFDSNRDILPKTQSEFYPDEMIRNRNGFGYFISVYSEKNIKVDSINKYSINLYKLDYASCDGKKYYGESIHCYVSKVSESLGYIPEKVEYITSYLYKKDSPIMGLESHNNRWYIDAVEITFEKYELLLMITDEIKKVSYIKTLIYEEA